MKNPARKSEKANVVKKCTLRILLYDMDKYKVLSDGLDKSDRRGRDIVPVPSTLSLSDGQSEGLLARLQVKVDNAFIDAKEGVHYPFSRRCPAVWWVTEERELDGEYVIPKDWVPSILPEHSNLIMKEVSTARCLRGREGRLQI